MASEQPYLFISHSSTDKPFAFFLSDNLEVAGFPCWVDVDDIPDGSTWPREIEKGVEQCGAMVVVMSPEGRASEWVERETLLALELGKPVLVALIEDTRLPIHLINRHFTDFREDKVLAMQQLIDALRNTTLVTDPPEKAKKKRAKLVAEPDEDSFFKYVEQLPDGEANAKAARELYDWARDKVDTVSFGGFTSPFFHARLCVDSNEVIVFSVRAYSRQPAVEVPLQYLKRFAPYDEREMRLSTLDALNDLLPEEERFADDRADRRPNLPLAQALDTTEKRDTFKRIVHEIVDNLRSS